MDRYSGLTLSGLKRYMLSSRVRVSARQISFAIEAGHLPEPARTTSGQRIWTPQEAALVLAYFQQRRQA